MPVPKLRSATQPTTLAPDNSTAMAQLQPVWDTERVADQAAAQVLNTMQQQGWSIVYPQAAFATSGVCAVMIGKLSRHRP